MACQKFVPLLTADAVAEDVFIALKGFKYTCRWKEFWMNAKTNNRAASTPMDSHQIHPPKALPSKKLPMTTIQAFTPA